MWNTISCFIAEDSRHKIIISTFNNCNGTISVITNYSCILSKMTANKLKPLYPCEPCKQNIMIVRKYPYEYNLADAKWI